MNETNKYFLLRLRKSHHKTPSMLQEKVPSWQYLKTDYGTLRTQSQIDQNMGSKNVVDHYPIWRENRHEFSLDVAQVALG